MTFDLHLNPRDLITDRFLPDLELLFPRPAKVRILMVLESGISPGPPSTNFGMGRVVSYLRDESFGFVNFEIDFALHGSNSDPTAVSIDPSAGEWDFRYLDFRFHSEEDGTPIIQNYDQVWCIGIQPVVHNNGNNDQVRNSDYSADDAELTVLTDWMDSGGGVLAMGDHNFLGAAMCWNIPRVGTMRAWLKDDNGGRSVPNMNGTSRHDTNRPANESQDPAITNPPQTIPNSVERDTVPQPLEWKRYSVWSPFIVQRRTRPHPVLCGGSLGVIDRFPDHPHEGQVIHEDLINLSAKYLHDTSKDEYPTVDGIKPTPEVIAWVHTLATPPHDHAKGEQPARRFPAIGVYDGHSIDHGRVLVDSTWHHWFDMNIAQLEAADTDDFRKIKRYFQNTAIWLAPKQAQQRMLSYASFWAGFSTFGFEELSIDLPIIQLGGQAIDILGRATSDCLVTTWLIDFLPRRVFEVIRKPFPIPEPCWSCPPDELITQAIMGGIMKEVLPYRDRLIEESWGCRNPNIRLDPKELDRAIQTGIQHGFEAIVENAKLNQTAAADIASRLGQAFKSGGGKKGKKHC